MLQFINVQKSYGHFLAVDIPRLTLNNGVYWLKGENGSGKTSFLKMIGGLHPFQGEIMIDGTGIRQQRTAFLQKVNYAEAEPLYPHFLTGKDLVQLYCTTKKAEEKDAVELLEVLRIRDAYHHPVGTYSSGMLKKLSLVLAFTGAAQWLLLDEPLITIDTDAVEAVCDMINRWHREKGVSFIITSHQSFQHHSLMLAQELLAVNKTIVASHA